MLNIAFEFYYCACSSARGLLRAGSYGREGPGGLCPSGGTTGSLVEYLTLVKMATMLYVQILAFLQHKRVQPLQVRSKQTCLCISSFMCSVNRFIFNGTGFVQVNEQRCCSLEA